MEYMKSIHAAARMILITFLIVDDLLFSISSPAKKYKPMFSMIHRFADLINYQNIVYI